MVHKIDRQDQLYGDASIQYYCYYRGRGSDECSWNLCAGAACYALLLGMAGVPSVLYVQLCGCDGDGSSV